MTTAYALLDLILLPDARVWHIATDHDTVLCDNKRFGLKGELEVGLDPHVVAHRGRAVCLRCRRKAAA